MWKCVASLCLMGLMAGCGNDAKDKMASGTKVENWAEREAFDSILMGPGMSGEMGDWKGGQNELDETALKAALDALNASTAPGGYDDTKKAAVVAAGDALIEAKKGDPKVFGEKYKAFTASLSGLLATE